MGKADYLQLGDWNAQCFFCGFKFKASTLVRYWQGFYVCKDCWEPRQPQDFVRGIPDIQTPPWVQPLPADVFVNTSWLETESSDDLTGVITYIFTETSYPLETET